mgnify:CR=1 FL=1
MQVPNGSDQQTSCAVFDIDKDGDLDSVFGGEYNSNQIWWWENPYPDYDPVIPWVRHTIKKSGLGKHHDQIIADFDGDGLSELVFWNQLMNALYIADIPDNPRELEEWDFKMIFHYSSDSEMQQRGEVPEWNRTNDHV